MSHSIKKLVRPLLAIMLWMVVCPDGAPSQGVMTQSGVYPVRDDWSYAKLVKAADLVVVVTLDSFAGDRYELHRGDPFSRDALDVRVSTFEVAATLKGIATGRTIEIVHIVRKGSVIDRSGKRFAKFQKTRKLPVFAAVVIDGEVTGFSEPMGTRTIKPEYLLFLKLRDDGRYELVSGDDNSEASVRILNLD